MAQNNNDDDRYQTDFGQRHSSDDNLRQTPFYWDDQHVYPFYAMLRDRMDNTNRIFNVSSGLNIIPDTGGGEQSKYNSNQDLQRLVHKDNGTHKSYTGSTTKNHHGNYTAVPQNDLNIMDYAKFRGFQYKLLRGQKGIEYRLQWGPESKTGNDFNSTYVALNPQPYYDDNHNPVIMKDDKGQTIKDSEGNPKQVQVTGKGAFVRFSQRNLGQGKAGDSLIRFIMQVNNLKSQPAAYAELDHMIKQYGTETRFDPQDPDVKTPQDSAGAFAYDKDYKPIHEKRSHNLDSHQHVNITNPYEKASDFARLNLRHKDLGTKPLQYLKNQLGYTNQQIKDSQIGWLPGKNDKNRDSLTHLFQGTRSYGMGINSQLTKVDLKGNFHDRFGGMFVKPYIKDHHIVGMQGLDKNLKPVQSVHNPRVLNYDHNYGAPSAFGFNKNTPNDKFRDMGAKFNELDPKKRNAKQRQQARDYVIGYLSDKRGISKGLVNHLMDDDLIRVGYGNRRDPKSSADLNKAHQGYHDTWGNKDDYSKGDFNMRNVKYLGRSNNKHLNRWGRDYPPYIEFAHKLGDKTSRNLTPDLQDTVGADRISFDRDKKGYQPDQRQNKRGKTVAGNSMHNYGFNVTYGKKSDNKKRKLFVFEDPIDLMSYLDTHRSEMNRSDEPSDLLSLGGSTSKTKTIDNYMHHKVDDSDERYNQIIFATDNDQQGQNVPLQYTEKERLQMPKSHLDKIFKVRTSPYGKDWNDAREYMHDHHKDYRSAFKDSPEKYNISEFHEKVLSDNLKGMSTEGIRTAYHIAKQSNKLHTDYVNNGSSMKTHFDPDITKDIKKSEYHMENLDLNSMKDNHDVYNAFADNPGNSLQPHEIQNGLENLVQEGALDRKVLDDPDLKDVTLNTGQSRKGAKNSATLSRPKKEAIADNQDDPFQGLDDKKQLLDRAYNRNKGHIGHVGLNEVAAERRKEYRKLFNESFQKQQRQNKNPNRNYKGPKR